MSKTTFTLSPFFVSKSNERAGFEIETEQEGTCDVPHLNHYWDYFAWRKNQFWPAFNNSAYHTWEVRSCWDKLLKQKCAEEKIDSVGYDVPVVAYNIYGHGRPIPPPPVKVEPLKFTRMVPSGVTDWSEKLDENYKDYLAHLYDNEL